MRKRGGKNKYDPRERERERTNQSPKLNYYLLRAKTRANKCPRLSVKSLIAEYSNDTRKGDEGREEERKKRKKVKKKEKSSALDEKKKSPIWSRISTKWE